MTANLQTELTVKEAAKLMNVSERTLYMALFVKRHRPDLEPELMAGRMSMNKAYSIAKNKPKETSWDRLVRAWNSATEADRERLLITALQQAEAQAQREGLLANSEPSAATRQRSHEQDEAPR